jgi:hypothetical protein
MNKNEAVDDLREAIQARKLWWDAFYQSLDEPGGMSPVRAWALIHYERIRKKELSWLLEALAEAEKRAAGP